MNIPELLRNDILLQAGTARRTDAPSSDAASSAPQSPALVVDEVETSILSDIKALIAQFKQDLNEIVAGGARAADYAKGTSPQYVITRDGAPSVGQNGLSSSGPEAGQDAETGIPEPHQAGTSQTAQGVLKVLLSKAQEWITSLTGTPSAANTGQKAIDTAIETVPTQQPPGGSNASGVELPAGVTPGPSSMQETGIRIESSPVQIPDNADKTPSAGTTAVIERQAGASNMAEPALQAEPRIVSASTQGTAETSVPGQVPEAAANVTADAATPVPAHNAIPIATVESGAEAIATTSRETRLEPNVPSGNPVDQAEQTLTESNETSAPVYGRLAANAFGVAAGNGQNQSPGNSSFQGLPVNPAAGDAASGLVPDMVDDAITARVAQFVEQMNGVLSAGQDEAAVQGEVAYTGSEAEARTALHTGSRAAQGAGGHGAVRQVLADVESLGGARSIGISAEKDAFLHLDTRLLSSSLSSNREETLTAIRQFANTVSDKVDSLASVLAAAYMSYNRLPQMRAVRGGEEAPSPEQEMAQEQGVLEQRLTELRLLIEKSEFLTKWLQGHVSDDAEFPEDTE